MLDRNNPKPLYVQLQEILREKIENNEWKPDSVIPSENELSRIFGVSRMTARSVLSQFVREGLLYRVQGKGTFVTADKITTSSLSYMGIREQLEKMGYEISTKVLEIKKAPCPERLLKKMELAPGSIVYAINRLRCIKDEPLSIHTSYIPSEYCEGLENQELVAEQLCVILDKEYGMKRGKVIETLESIMAGEKESKLLSVRRSYPLLLLEDTIYDTDGKLFEYTRVLFRGDKVKIRVEYDN